MTLFLSVLVSAVTATGPTMTITPNWLRQHGSGPYVLSQPNTTYVLKTDVTTSGTAFVVLGQNITLNLNGHTVTYGDSTPVALANGGFEQGTGSAIPGWNIAAAPAAALAPNTSFLFDKQVLRLANFSSAQTIVSDPIPLSLINHSYKATITPSNADGADGTSVAISVIDTLSGKVLGAGSSRNAQRGFSAVADFTPTTPHPVRLEVIVTPPPGVTTSIDIDAASLNVSHDYGVIAAGAWSGDAPGILNLPASVRASYDAKRSIMIHRANFTLINGAVVQGQGHGTDSSALFLEGSNGLTIDHVLTRVTGIDTRNVDAFHAKGDISITNCTFRDDVPNITNRMGVFATVGLFDTRGKILIKGNKILGSPQVGIGVDSNNGFALAINDNEIRQNSIVADAYGIMLVGVSNFQVNGNAIKPQSGEGIMVDGFRDLSTNGAIQNNSVIVKEKPNREIGTKRTYARALRLRNTDGSARSAQTNLEISRNTFVASCAPGYAQCAYAVWISYINPVGAMDNARISLHNNLIKGIADTADPSYRAIALDLDGIDDNINLIIYENVLESNDASLGVGGYNDGNVSGVALIGNTLSKLREGPTRRYSGISAGFWQCQISKVLIFDTISANGATTNVSWIGPGAKKIRLGNLLNVQVKNPNGQAVPGATVEIFDRAKKLLYRGITDPHGNLSKIPLITTTHTQTGTDSKVIVTSALDGPLTVRATIGATTTSLVETPANRGSVSIVVP